MTAVQDAPAAVPVAPGAHKAVPVQDSWYEEVSQHPANLRAWGSYPLTAVCTVCHRRIRCAALGRKWEHGRVRWAFARDAA